jgi:hypothetical protein
VSVTQKSKLPPTVSRPVCLGVKHPLWSKPRFLFLSDGCGFVDVACPLWRQDGCVVYNCCWASLAQSFSDPSPAGLMTIFYCLRFETPPNWRTRSPYSYSLGTGWPSYTFRHRVPFSSPPTPRTAVEVFEPASTQANRSLKVKVRVRVTLRLAVYRQSVRLGVKPLETHDQTFFFQLDPCGDSPYVTSSLSRRWFCLLWICLAFRQVYISHI